MARVFITCKYRAFSCRGPTDPASSAIRAVDLAIGIRCSGHKEILGLWIEQTEGAKFWLRVMTELKNRGTQDVLIAVIHDLKGLPEAIESVFPQAEVQTCIAHLIRYSMQFASWKERKHVAKAASKLNFLSPKNAEAKWKNPPINWHQAKAQFAIHFEDRFVVTD